MTEETKPRLFYWEDAVDGWAPADGVPADVIVSLDMLEPNEETAIRFKRIDMGDAEYDNLPEV